MDIYDFDFFLLTNISGCYMAMLCLDIVSFICITCSSLYSCMHKGKRRGLFYSNCSGRPRGVCAAYLKRSELRTPYLH